MKSFVITFFAGTLFALPFSAHAEIRINEVAWMGGNGNANCEWIELYNPDDTTIDISGWSFEVGSTTNPVLEAMYPGDLVIEPYGYYVIARKFSATAASATTCHPYFESFNSVHLGGVGALNNTALSISIFDANKLRIDSITGDTINWSDYSKANTGNYDTMQRSGTSWTLNTPTPSGSNTAPVPESVPEQTTTTVTTSSNTATVKKWDSDQIRSLSINVPETLHVGVPFTFSSLTSPKDARKFKSHTWNFGDFTTSRLSSPIHTYLNPGTYVVHLTVDGDIPLELSKTITVVASTLHALRLSNGDLEITNNGSISIDLSSFTILGTTSFTIPSHSTILAGAKLVIPSTIVLNARGIVSPEGVLIAAVDATKNAVSTSFVAHTPSYTERTTVAATPTLLAHVLPLESGTTSSVTTSISDLPVLTATATATSTTFPAYFTLIILLLVAIGASLIKTRLQ